MTGFDIGIVVLMLLSGFLAMARGFVAEMLSILAWIVALAVTLFLYPYAFPSVREMFSADWIAAVVAQRCPNAVRCADPFHVVAWATDALDEVRRQAWNEARCKPPLSADEVAHTVDSVALLEVARRLRGKRRHG